ncbi:Putative peptidoglycan binding domain-containing protein [Roseovarius litoreus]|uniref:Peptidoglycan binding domain-containing protein n=1 Tax=Roseovarius litoreus TaxID=1155722 RepID=A0A1M7F380_9RHOB|nr:peptidoglycan-binding domain-containing protein [Roseovarius litoreus]SHL98117.1 Putative peptidoglycan binding domain-containing protein [Roseovarius litoreus]
MKRFLQRRHTIICAVILFAGPLAAQEDPNALMNDAISLYTSAMTTSGEDRFLLLQEVDGILTRIETEFPDSAPASVMQLGIPLGPIDLNTLEAELAASEPKLADRLSGELADQWKILQERSPAVAATVEDTLRKVAGSAANETKEELYVKVSYYVMAAFYFVTESSFHEFFDPSETGELYKAFVTSRGLDTALSDFGRSGATDIALGIALDFGSSTIADSVVENSPEMSSSTRTLVHAAIKATITEVLLAVQASKDATKIPGLGIKRVSDLVEILVTTRGLAADVDRALAETALRMQTLAQLTVSYRELEGVQDIITSTRQNLASELEGAVGKDDAKAVSDIMLLGWAALTAEFEGETAQAENLHDLLLSRGNVDSMPTIWNAPDLAVYLAKGFTDSPKRAAEIMIGLTELSKYSKPPEQMEMVTTPSTSPDLAGTQIAPDGFLGPGAELKADGVTVASEKAPSRPSQTALFEALPDGVYSVESEVCARQGEAIIETLDRDFRILRRPQIWLFDLTCSIVDATESEDATEVAANCNAEGVFEERVFRWQVTGPQSFIEFNANVEPKAYQLCEDTNRETLQATSTEWNAAIAVESSNVSHICFAEPSRSCLEESEAPEEAIRFIEAQQALGYGYGLIPVDFKELGKVDIAYLMAPNAAGTIYPRLVNTTPESITSPQFPDWELRKAAESGDREAVSVLRQYPDSSGWNPLVLGMRVLPNGYQRFSLVMPYTEFCRACPYVAYGVNVVDYDQSGQFRSFESRGVFDARDLKPKWNTQFTAEDARRVPALIQYFLNIRGYDAGPMDGAIGPRTQAALADFQRENSVSDGSGRVDQATLNALVDQDTMFSNGASRSTNSSDANYAAGVAGKFSTGGEFTQWVQVASQNTLSEAREFALQQGDGARIFRTSNGWYAVTLGLLNDPEFDYLPTMVRENGLPMDTFLTTGETYVEEMSLFAGGAKPAPAFVKTEVIGPAETFVDQWYETGTVTEVVGEVTAGQELTIWGQPRDGRCYVSPNEGVYVYCADTMAFSGTAAVGGDDSARDASLQDSEPEAPPVGLAGTEPVLGPVQHTADEIARANYEHLRAQVSDRFHTLERFVIANRFEDNKDVIALLAHPLLMGIDNSASAEDMRPRISDFLRQMAGLLDLTEDDLRLLSDGRNSYQAFTIDYLEVSEGSGWSLAGPYEKEFHVAGLDGDSIEKWINVDGREYVFDTSSAPPRIINYDRNSGTFNYGSDPNTPLHVALDIMPWLHWGTGPDDTSSFEERYALMRGAKMLQVWLRLFNPIDSIAFDLERVGGDNLMTGPAQAMLQRERQAEARTDATSSRRLNLTEANRQRESLSLSADATKGEDFKQDRSQETEKVDMPAQRACVSPAQPIARQVVRNAPTAAVERVSHLDEHGFVPGPPAFSMPRIGDLRNNDDTSIVLAVLDRSTALAALKETVIGAWYINPSIPTISNDLRVSEDKLPLLQNELERLVRVSEPASVAIAVDAIDCISQFKFDQTRSPFRTDALEELRFVASLGYRAITLWQSGVSGSDVGPVPIMSFGFPPAGWNPKMPELDPEGIMIGRIGVAEVRGIFQTDTTAEVEFTLSSEDLPPTIYDGTGTSPSFDLELDSVVARAIDLGLGTRAIIAFPSLAGLERMNVDMSDPSRVYTAVFRKYDDGWRFFSVR